MKSFFIDHESPLAAGLTVLAMAISYAAGSARGIIGMSLGIVSGVFSFGVLWRVSSALAASVKGPESVKPGTFITVLAFLMKLPILILLAAAMRKVGGPAPGCFAAGFAMVYFAAVGRACARS